MRPNLRFPDVRTAETAILGLLPVVSLAVLKFTVLNSVCPDVVLLVSVDDRYFELPWM